MTEILPSEITDQNDFRLNTPSQILFGSIISMKSGDYGDIKVETDTLIPINNLDETLLECFNYAVDNNKSLSIQSFVLSFDVDDDLCHDDYIFLSQLFTDPSLEDIYLGLDAKTMQVECFNPEQIFAAEMLGVMCDYVTLSYTEHAWEHIGPNRTIDTFGG